MMCVFSRSARAVTLNLFHLAVTSFQGPFRLSSSGRAARWMLKQVQHDKILGNSVSRRDAEIRRGAEGPSLERNFSAVSAISAPLRETDFLTFGRGTAQ